MPTVEDVRKSGVGESDGTAVAGVGDGQLGAAAGLDSDLLLDYTERVQSFFPECKNFFVSEKFYKFFFTFFNLPTRFLNLFSFFEAQETQSSFLACTNSSL